MWTLLGRGMLWGQANCFGFLSFSRFCFTQFSSCWYFDVFIMMFSNAVSSLVCLTFLVYVYMGLWVWFKTKLCVRVEFFVSFYLLFEFWQYSVTSNRHFIGSLNRIILCSLINLESRCWWYFYFRTLYVTYVYKYMHILYESYVVLYKTYTIAYSVFELCLVCYMY